MYVCVCVCDVIYVCETTCVITNQSTNKLTNLRLTLQPWPVGREGSEAAGDEEAHGEVAAVRDQPPERP